MTKNAAYQVLAVYKCNICKEDHQSGLVLPSLLPDPGARLAEMADMKIQVYNSIKKIFANTHAPTDKFNPKRLTITEIDDKGKSRKVKISDIEELLKGGLTEIEKIEAKRGLSPETPEKVVKDEGGSSAGLALVAGESPIESSSSPGLALAAKESATEEKETPFQDTGKKEGMSFEEIREKVKIRIAELQKASKGCREMMEKLGISLKETRMEAARLQSLLKAIDQPEKKGKKNVRKKQKPKSK